MSHVLPKGSTAEVQKLRINITHDMAWYDYSCGPKDPRNLNSALRSFVAPIRTRKTSTIKYTVLFWRNIPYSVLKALKEVATSEDVSVDLVYQLIKGPEAGHFWPNCLDVGLQDCDETVSMVRTALSQTWPLRHKRWIFCLDLLVDFCSLSVKKTGEIADVPME